MSNRSAGRNDPCPCGSGRKYKKCCIHNGYRYERSPQGTIRRSIPIPPDLEDALAEHRKGLEAHYGRDLQDDDLLFPDIQLEHAEHHMSQAMRLAGIDPALIYAFEKTGLLVSEENRDRMSEEQLDAWHDAVEEFRERQLGLEPQRFPVGTIALYGPDNTSTTKMVASVLIDETSDPIQKKFYGDNLAKDRNVAKEIAEFFKEYHIEESVITEGNIGCPHEEGIDYPLGESCPKCPFWRDRPLF